MFQKQQQQEQYVCSSSLKTFMLFQRIESGQLVFGKDSLLDVSSAWDGLELVVGYGGVFRTFNNFSVQMPVQPTNR